MDLNISNKQIEDVSVVALRGRIVLGEGSSALRERVKNLVGGITAWSNDVDPSVPKY